MAQISLISKAGTSNYQDFLHFKMSLHIKSTFQKSDVRVCQKSKHSEVNIFLNLTWFLSEKMIFNLQILETSHRKLSCSVLKSYALKKQNFIIVKCINILLQGTREFKVQL